ncbi:hypothetical protein ST47_g9499 [Ascochyta rabiei]|uniref:Uncharacterized protein n=1 Tax=Didymella rabiei TaxID=5454 RepID=A0A162X420_DIDRA|nr:hypothetical protein ST47_g9499 [Ascochyta rabiei]
MKRIQSIVGDDSGISHSVDILGLFEEPRIWSQALTGPGYLNLGPTGAITTPNLAVDHGEGQSNLIGDEPW